MVTADLHNKSSDRIGLATGHKWASTRQQKAGGDTACQEANACYSRSRNYQAFLSPAENSRPGTNSPRWTRALVKNAGCTQIVRRSLLSDSPVHLLATDEEILTKNHTGAIRFSYNVTPRCLKRTCNYINNPRCATTDR